RMGAHEYSSEAQGLCVGSCASTEIPLSISLLARPSYCAGAYVWNGLSGSERVVPVTSCPTSLTLSTLPASTFAINSLNWIVVSRGPRCAEKFHTATATTTRASQNTRLFNVEFKTLPPTPLIGGPAPFT